MSDEFQIKIDPRPPKKKESGGWAGTGLKGGAIAGIVLLLLARGVGVYMKNAPERQQQEQMLRLQQQQQQQQAMKVLNDAIQNTPPEKMSKSMRILLGIDDGKEQPNQPTKHPDAPSNPNDQHLKLNERTPER